MTEQEGNIPQQEIKAKNPQSPEAGVKVDRNKVEKTRKEMDEDAEIQEIIKKDIGTLQKFSSKIRTPLKVAIMAFALDLMSAAQSFADKLGTQENKIVNVDQKDIVAKAEKQEVNFEQLKKTYTVPDSLRELAKYEDTTGWYVGVCDQIVYLANHKGAMMDEEVTAVLTAAPKLITPEELEKSITPDSRLSQVENNAKNMTIINGVYVEVQPRVEGGITMSPMDVAQK